jgi:hypothetical protein
MQYTFIFQPVKQNLSDTFKNTVHSKSARELVHFRYLNLP